MRRAQPVVAVLACLCLLAAPGCRRGAKKQRAVSEGAREVAETLRESAEAADRARRFEAYEPRPLPAGEDALTDEQFAPERLKFLRSMSVDLYREIGWRDPSWDDEAEALLEAYARREADMPDRPTVSEYVELADAMSATGCDDPLVNMAAGIAYFHARRFADAAEHLFQPPPLDRETPDYPNLAIWRENAVGWHVQQQLGRFSEAQLDGMREVVSIAITRGLEETQFEGLQARAAFAWLRDAEDELTWGQRDQFAQKLERLTKPKEGEKPEADPWLTHMVLGEVEIAIAWGKRGGGLAREVPQRGWQGFAEHLEKARDALEQAWELKPEWPEAPARMVTVAMGDGGPIGERRMWFDRAVSGQFDYLPAYSNYSWSLLPRWGGSHEALWELAHECLDTGRFDTLVPFQMLDGAVLIGETDGELAFWRRDDVYDALVQMFEGYLGADDPPISENCIMTHWTVVAWRHGNAARAQKILTELGEDLCEDTVLRVFGFSAEELRREVAVAASPQAKRLAQAREAYESGDREAAAQKFRAVLEASPAPEVTDGARSGLKAIEIERAFEAGKPIELVPGCNVGECIDVVGEWSVAEDGALVHHPADGEEAMLLFPADIKDNYHLSADIVFPTDDDRVSAGFIFGHAYPNVGMGRGSEVLLADRYSHHVQPNGGRMLPHARTPVHINRRMTLGLEVYRQTFAAYVDGERVLQGRPLLEWYEEPPHQLLGLMLSFRGPVTDPVRFERVSLRPLTEEPEDWVHPQMAKPSEGARGWAGARPGDEGVI